MALNKAGETTWKARYEAFGKARIDNASTAQINLRLPGQYFDAETGLHQNWNRDYAPGIGRYVQADPIGLAGGLNRYVYANGNPLSKIDSKGLHSVVIPVPGAIGIGGGSTVFMGGAIAVGIVGAGIFILTDRYINPWLQPLITKGIDYCMDLGGRSLEECLQHCDVAYDYQVHIYRNIKTSRERSLCYQQAMELYGRCQVNCRKGTRNE